MADDDVHYEIKTVTTVRGTEARSKAKWEKERWEFVSQSEQPLLRTKLTFRRVKPKPPWLLLGTGVGVLVAIGIIVTVMSLITGGGNDDSAQPTARPPTSAAAPSAQPSEESTPAPEPSAPAEVAPLTDAEVVAFFQAYIEERVAAGVVFAAAITDVSFSDRILRVTFDPAVVGYDQATFDEVTPFKENYAEFVVNPIGSSADLPVQVRASMDAVETVQADGTPAGNPDDCLGRRDERARLGARPVASMPVRKPEMASSATDSPAGG